jgi:hypothetical protein
MRSAFFVVCVAAILFAAYDMSKGPESLWWECWSQFQLSKYPKYDPSKMPGNPAFPIRNDDLEAPLRSCDDDDIIPDDYVVYLHYGYSFEDHERTIDNAFDLEGAIRKANGQGTDADASHLARYGSYSAILDSLGLAAVRADPGVDAVACNSWVYLIE